MHQGFIWLVDRRWLMGVSFIIDQKLEGRPESIYDRVRRPLDWPHLKLAVTQNYLQGL